ncbi:MULTISPECIES: hypothetical protein [unclassified Bradyrhizobium]
MGDYVLNSACLSPSYSSQAEASVHITQLLEGLAAVDDNSDRLPVLRLPSDPWGIILFKDAQSGTEVSLGELAHSLYFDVNTRDHAAYFDQLARTIPTDQGLDEEIIEELLRLEPDKPVPNLEHTFKSVQAAGLDATLCALTGSLLLSLLRDQLWNFSRMGFLAEEIEYAFDHIANVGHSNEILARRLAVTREDLTLRNFWANKEAAFPHLIFGADVESQLKNFDSRYIPLLFRRLAELNEKSRIWSQTGHLPTTPPAITPESKATMSQFGDNRRFSDSNGNPQTFEDHVWVESTNRVHILLHDDSRRIEIGYVGHHLPTATQPT